MEFPPLVATVGDLARWIMAHKPDLAGLVRGRWTREQVAARVREIVIEQLDCASSYREDASFVQDLGAGRFEHTGWAATAPASIACLRISRSVTV